MNAKASHPWNIVLITLDCVRPDFLGCYGCQAVRTPNLDRLAARGVVFEQAITQAPNTWVSHAGILTGLYPHLHGLRSPYDRLGPEVPTLASLLAEAGYRTAGFPGNDLLGSRAGFGRGFDLYYEEYRLCRTADPAPAANGVSANNRNRWEDVLRAAETWLQAGPEPFFVWFHYLDTHHLPECDLPDYYRFSRDPQWQFYEGKISLADQRCVGAVLEMLERHGSYERTLFFILSDHGEELVPGLPPFHNGALSDRVLRVPLIVFCPSMAGSGVRVSQQVRTADLVPTVLEEIGPLPPGSDNGGGAAPGFSGNPLPLPGLFPVPRRLAASGRGLAYAENEPLGFYCLRTEEWKYLVTPDGEILFHLASDPAEQANVLSRHPRTAEYFRREMEELGVRGPSTVRVRADREEEETRRLLKSFGYIE